MHVLLVNLKPSWKRKTFLFQWDSSLTDHGSSSNQRSIVSMWEVGLQFQKSSH